MKGFSHGLEIEAVDFDRREIVLPEGCSFNQKEVTLVNSCGRAVNSRKDSTFFIGGEINTKPTTTYREQLKVAEKCLKLLKEQSATINYRCNLHAHIGLAPELRTLKNLKKIQDYAFKHFDVILRATMGEGQFTRNPDMPAETWHHYKERMVPEWKHQHLMNSTSLKDFQMGFFKNKAGTHAPLTFMRQGINTHSFFKTFTIEGRIFWATLDLDEIENIMMFMELFVEQALTDQIPVKEYIHSFSFPKELPFSIDLEKGFQKTKVQKP